MWGCFLMSGVKILHFLKDWWKSIPIHQNYTMALNTAIQNYYFLFGTSSVHAQTLLSFVELWVTYGHMTNVHEFYTVSIYMHTAKLGSDLCQKKIQVEF